MNPDLFPRRDWKERPYDPKCKKVVAFDPVVDEQIRCKLPLWSGDFDEVIPELTAAPPAGQGLSYADLPLLTVRQVGQHVIRTSQLGPLRAGPVGTAAHTIVTLSPAARESTATIDDEHAAIARKLDGKARRVLWYMRESEADRMVEGLTRQFIADALKISIDDVAEVFKTLRACGKNLYESKRGCMGRVWLSPDGSRVAGHCKPADAIAATLKKRA